MADTKLQSLTEIFNERFFRIPDFQRGFSWEGSQLEDFWEDMINLKNGKIHYIGLLTVEPIIKESIERIEKWQDDLWLFERDLKAYYLIDGQQRLTTSIILINELLNAVKSGKSIFFRSKEEWQKKFLFQEYNEEYKSYVFGYERDNPSDEYFKTKILNQISLFADKVPEQTLYTANLQRAKEFFQEKLKDLLQEELEEIFRKIISRFKYNFYEIDDNLDVYVTFETMNNRGKPLSNLELLKNRMIYLSTLLEIDEDTRKRLRDDINETWKTIYEYLGRNSEYPLDDDEFLRNHWIMYFKYDRKESEVYAKFLLSQKFTPKNVLNGKLKIRDIKDYVESLSLSVKSWFSLFNPQYSNFSNEIKEWIQKLNRLGMRAFPPLFMASMQKYQEADLLSLFKAAEKFIFLIFIITQRQANTKNSHFYRLANSIYFEKDNVNIQSVIENIKFNCLGKSLTETGQLLEGWLDPQKFNDYLRDRFISNEGFYSWNGLKYFLYEYELFLQNKASGNEKVSWNDFNQRKKENTIEHIYPQSPKDECWTSIFEKHGFWEKRYLLHGLGNLLLLSNSKNSELQNNCFSYKKRHTNKNGDKVGYLKREV